MDDPIHTTGEDSRPVQSVLITLGIMKALAESERPRGVTELAVGLGLNKSRIYRHLRTLLGEGYVVQDLVTERYSPGPALRRLARSLSDSQGLVDAARGPMQAVWADLGHTTALCRVGVDGIRVIEVLTSPSAIEITGKFSPDLPLHATAQGKIVLAFGDEDNWTRLLAQPLSSLTSQTITDFGRLEREIETVRKRGWSTMPGEALPGINALAVPIVGAGNELVGTLAILDSIQLIPDPPTDRQIGAMLAASRRISEALL